MKNRLPNLIIQGEWQYNPSLPVTYGKQRTHNFAAADNLALNSPDTINQLIISYGRARIVAAASSGFGTRLKKACPDPEIAGIVENYVAFQYVHDRLNLDGLDPASQPAAPYPDLDKLPEMLRAPMHRAYMVGVFSHLALFTDLTAMYTKAREYAALAPRSIPLRLANVANMAAEIHDRSCSAPFLAEHLPLYAKILFESCLLLPQTGNSKGSSKTTPHDGIPDGRKIWGEMEFCQIELSNKLRLPRSIRRAFVGAPVYIHRYVTDAKMFRLRRRNQTGTILVDVSGSMSLTSAMVAEAIQRKPLGTIAVYSGDDAKEGHLTIIAERGRMFEASDHTFPGGNTVDGLALDWLCTQPAPRIWVSDGGITHPYGTEKAAIQYCDTAMQRGNITRFHRFEDYLENSNPQFTTKYQY